MLGLWDSPGGRCCSGSGFASSGIPAITWSASADAARSNSANWSRRSPCVDLRCIFSPLTQRNDLVLPVGPFPAATWPRHPFLRQSAPILPGSGQKLYEIADLVGDVVVPGYRIAQMLLQRGLELPLDTEDHVRGLRWRLYAMAGT